MRLIFPASDWWRRHDAWQDFVGGLWVLEVSSRARALALIEADPYVASGLRRWQLRTWGKAFAERQVVL